MPAFYVSGRMGTGSSGRPAKDLQTALTLAAAMHKAGLRQLRIYSYALGRLWHFRIGDELAGLGKFAPSSSGWVER